MSNLQVLENPSENPFAQLKLRNNFRRINTKLTSKKFYGQRPALWPDLLKK